MGRRRLLVAADAERQERTTSVKIELQSRGHARRKQRGLDQPQVTEAQILRQPQQPVVVHDHVLQQLLPFALALAYLESVYRQRVPAAELFRLRFDAHRAKNVDA